MFSTRSKSFSFDLDLFEVRTTYLPSDNFLICKAIAGGSKVEKQMESHCSKERRIAIQLQNEDCYSCEGDLGIETNSRKFGQRLLISSAQPSSLSHDSRHSTTRSSIVSLSIGLYTLECIESFIGVPNKWKTHLRRLFIGHTVCLSLVYCTCVLLRDLLYREITHIDIR